MLLRGRRVGCWTSLVKNFQRCRSFLFLSEVEEVECGRDDGHEGRTLVSQVKVHGIYSAICIFPTSLTSYYAIVSSALWAHPLVYDIYVISYVPRLTIILETSNWHEICTSITNTLPSIRYPKETKPHSPWLKSILPSRSLHILSRDHLRNYCNPSHPPNPTGIFVFDRDNVNEKLIPSDNISFFWNAQ